MYPRLLEPPAVPRQRRTRGGLSCTGLRDAVRVPRAGRSSFGAHDTRDLSTGIEIVSVALTEPVIGAGLDEYPSSVRQIVNKLLVEPVQCRPWIDEMKNTSCAELGPIGERLSHVANLLVRRNGAEFDLASELRECLS